MQIILKAKTLLSNIEGLFEAWFLQLLSFERSLFGFCFNLFMNRKVQNFGQNFKRRIQSKGVGKVVLDAVGGSLCSIFECLCSLFSTTILEKNCWPQQDSNSDCLNSTRARWPIEHHHSIVMVNCTLISCRHQTTRRRWLNIKLILFNYVAISWYKYSVIW